jgi:hypothetical protein
MSGQSAESRFCVPGWRVDSGAGERRELDDAGDAFDTNSDDNGVHQPAARAGMDVSKRRVASAVIYSVSRDPTDACNHAGFRGARNRRRPCVHISSARTELFVSERNVGDSVDAYRSCRRGEFCRRRRHRPSICSLLRGSSRA